MAPLDWAAAGMHAGVARQLLDAGADPSGSRPDMTPLQVASDRGSIALVSLLLERGADPTVALEIAESWLGVDVEASLRDEVSADDVELVVRREPRAEGSELIEVTARRDGGGRTAARETGHARIVELLRARRSSRFRTSSGAPAQPRACSPARAVDSGMRRALRRLLEALADVALGVGVVAVITALAPCRS